MRRPIPVPLARLQRETDSGETSSDADRRWSDVSGRQRSWSQQHLQQMGGRSLSSSRGGKDPEQAKQVGLDRLGRRRREMDI